MMRNRFYQSIVFVMLFLAACNPSDKREARQEATHDSDEQQQTDLLSKVELTDLEGNAIKLDDYAGKTILLNFWATWCKPCIVEMPSMVEARQLLGDNFVFLLASDEGVEKISSFVEKQAFDLPFVQLQNGIQNLQITALPTTWVIRDEKVLKEIMGSREWNTEAHINELKSL